METTDLAMVSRIRVETRGQTMEAAERAAFTLLDHARMAGLLEGIVPESGEYTDHFFNRPEMHSKPGQAPEPWNELGLTYAGRLTFTFDPMVVSGGLRQFGFVSFRLEPDYGPGLSDNGGWMPFDALKPETVRDLRETTAESILLSRQRPVTRENSWEGVPRLTSDPDMVVADSAEGVLDHLRALPSVEEVRVGPDRMSPSGTGWRVEVEMKKAPGDTTVVPMVLSVGGATLSEAAQEAYRSCFDGS